MQTNGNDSTLLALRQAKKNWPHTFVFRSQVKKFAGDLISPKNLARLTSHGKGPKGVFRKGMRVCYPVETLTDWLIDRYSKKKCVTTPSSGAENKRKKSMFIMGTGSWTEYRTLGDHYEIDFHDGYIPGVPKLSYWERMSSFNERTFDALRTAYENGVPYVIFTHGYSTSGPFKTTARSIVRGIMRDKQSTPFVIKCKSIQHNSVFVAAIRPKKD